MYSVRQKRPRMNLSNLMLEFAVLNLLYFQSPGGVRFLSAHRLAGRPARSLDQNCLR